MKHRRQSSGFLSKTAFVSLCFFLAHMPVCAASEQTPAVIELFTSQGCSACLSADALANTLAADKGLVTLTYPVTIWDYLGWRDTLARPEFTLRQRGYAATRGDGKMYTPQVVVNGLTHHIGSERAAIEKDAEDNAARGQSVFIRPVRHGDVMDISVGAWAEKHDEPPRARVYLVSFLKEASVPVRAGENAGKTTHYANIVQSVREIGYWHGEQLDLRLFWNPSETQGGAILLQSNERNGPGRIFGAAYLP